MWSRRGRDVIDTCSPDEIPHRPQGELFYQRFCRVCRRQSTRSPSPIVTGSLHLALWALASFRAMNDHPTAPLSPSRSFTHTTATAEVLAISRRAGRCSSISLRHLHQHQPGADEEALLENASIICVRAIEPVHFSGHRAICDRISSIARRYDLKIVEAAAHAGRRSAPHGGRCMAKIVTIGGSQPCSAFYAPRTSQR